MLNSPSRHPGLPGIEHTARPGGDQAPSQSYWHQAASPLANTTPRSTSVDRYGLPLSTSSPLAATTFQAGLDRLLASDAGAADCFQRSVDADDGCARAQVALAVVCRLRGDTHRARTLVARAITLNASLPEDERLHVATLAAFVQRPTGALPSLADHLQAVPHDVLALYLTVLLIGRSGTRDWQQQMYATLSNLASRYGDDWWFLGAYAMAHEEIGDLEGARRLAERSLERNPRNAGAAHPLAHADYETAEHTAGARRLRSWLASYDPSAPLHSHLSWHLALFALAAGNVSHALAIYEQSIRPGATQATASIVDAASLLWRVQLCSDVEVEDRWANLHDLARSHRAGTPLNDTHAALALAATGDEAVLRTLNDDLRALASRGQSVAGEVVLPLVHGIAAFGRADYPEAVRHLEAVHGQIVRIGGSNAQREVVEETLLVACLRAGLFERARSLILARLERRPSRRDDAWLQAAQAPLAVSAPVAFPAPAS
jgi:tetratricopeptide (TPR) repeat protein